jgi:hypothetical protein
MVLVRRGRLSFVLLALLLGFPSAVGGQVPPGEVWRSLETEHFRITYPARLLDLARRAGERAERAWEALSATLVTPPRRRVDLVLTDHADVSNGFARVFPSNRIVVYAPPPVDGFGLAYMDEWLELVVTHELVHVFHFDYAEAPGGVLRKIFGRVPLEWPFFPGASTPGWVVEGMATYYESELTQAGRVRGTFHEMVIRTAILEDRFEGPDQAAGDSPVWPGGQRYYIYGSIFLKYLMDLHGPEAMGRFVKAVAGQWIPYRLNAAAKEAFGVSFSDAWRGWKETLEIRYAELSDSLASLAPLTQPEALTAGGYYAWSPEPSPDGSLLAFARVDGRSDPQIRLRSLETGQEWKGARTNNLSQFSWTPEGDVLFSQLHHTDSYRMRGDLFRFRRDGGVVQVTEDQRLDHPDVSPDGGSIVAVQEGLGTNRLVVVDGANGSVTPITEFSDRELWAYPRWSPNGRWIAASRWRPGAFFNLVILTPDGEILQEVTHGRGVDNGPAWSPDGRWLLWSSDRSGIPNLYAASIDRRTGHAASIRQVTNLLGGGAYPSVDPEGRWIFFSSYHADGWRVERIPFAPEEWFEPFAPHPRFRLDPSAPSNPGRLRARVDGREKPYDPLPTLRPTFWAPSYRVGDHVGGVEVLKPGYGFFTSGEDVVGRHSFSIAGTWSGRVGRFSGQGSYSYAGLENPVLGLWAAQSYDAFSRPLAGITQEGDTVPVFRVDRDRWVGLDASFFRIRSRSRTVARLSAAHIWEERIMLEEDLRESQRFRWTRPNVRLAQLSGTIDFGNARLYAFSISPEDGIALSLRGRARRDLTVADSLRDIPDSDYSFQDLVARLAMYKGFEGPGFGRHVLGLRISGGVSSGPGADAGHFEVGGASGGNLPVDFLALGQSLLFPVRGYRTARRYGRYAWSGSLEYRFPVKMMNRGPGLLPLYLDWLSGALFLDAGNAWGPTGAGHRWQNPRQETLASVGGELLVRILPLWFQTLDVRFGAAMPLVGQKSLQGYLRLGLPF